MTDCISCPFCNRKIHVEANDVSGVNVLQME